VNGLAYLVTVCLHGSNLKVYTQSEKHSLSRDKVCISICLIEWNIPSNIANKRTVHVMGGPDSIDGIATGDRLDGPGIESW